MGEPLENKEIAFESLMDSYDESNLPLLFHKEDIKFAVEWLKEELCQKIFSIGHKDWRNCENYQKPNPHLGIVKCYFCNKIDQAFPDLNKQKQT